MISNYEIRKRAREILGAGLFTASWLCPVLVLLVVSALSGLLTNTYVGPLLVAGLLSVASTCYFLKRARSQISPNNLEVCIDSLKSNFTNAIIVSLLIGLFVAIGSMLFIVPGIIFGLSFSVAYHVMNDRPELSPMEVLRESHRLMKGHRWQLFCLEFSFIGWYILGAFCLGVGSLWAGAYATTATAVFYDELVANDRGYFTVNEEPASAE